MLASILGVILVLAYPVAVYVGLSRWNTRAVGVMLLVILIPSYVLRAVGETRRADLRAILPVPVAVIIVIVLGIILDDHRAMLALPVLINVALLVTFGGSLMRGVPMVERFARLARPDLPESQLPYCRQVTAAWCGFFVLNGATCAALAMWAPVGVWTLYTGAIAYVIIGLLFVLEYLVRKYRFREYGLGLHDRIIAAVFPPPRPAPEVTER